MLSRPALPLLFSVLALGGVGCTREKPIDLPERKEQMEGGKDPGESEAGRSFGQDASGVRSPVNSIPEATAGSPFPVSTTPAMPNVTGDFNPLSAQWAEWYPEECPDFLVATNPSEAVPPIRWKACAGNVPGCRELEVTWTYTTTPTRSVYVQRVRGQTTLSVSTWVAGPGGTTVPWSFLTTAEGNPLGAWRRTNTASGVCGGPVVDATDSHYCMGLGRTRAAPEKSIGLLAWLDVEAPHSRILRHAPTQAVGLFQCSEELFIGADSARIWSYHLGRQEEKEVQLPGGTTALHRVYRDKVLAVRGGANAQGEFMDGWVWTHEDGATPLIQPQNGFVLDLQTDGTHLVWQIGLGSNALLAHRAEVWVSSLSLNADALQPRKIGEIPQAAMNFHGALARNGYYAATGRSTEQEGSPRRLSIFRLADGKRWVIEEQPPVPNNPTVAIGPAYHIDSEEIWYYRGGTIARQRIADLIEVTEP